MTLLVSVFAAVVCTVLWYRSAPENEMRLDVLCWLFWGASLMWTCDAIFEYAELKDEFFQPATADMINDAFLGLSAVAFGMVIWVVILLIKDPKGVIKAKLAGKS